MALDLDTLNDKLAECGCCTHPTCCPPQIECESGSIGIDETLFTKPQNESDSSEPPWDQVKYRTWLLTINGVSDSVSEEAVNNMGVTVNVLSSVLDANWTFQNKQEYEFPFEVTPFTNESDSVDCKLGRSAGFTQVCTFTGSESFTQYTAILPSLASTYVSYTAVRTVESIAGEVALDWLSWKTGKDAFDDATAAHEEWTQNPIGDEPSIPDAPGEEPAKFYPPCSFKMTLVEDFWDYDYNGDGVYHIEFDQDGTPLPRTTVFYNTGGLPDMLGAGPAVIEYQNPVTWAQFIAEAEDYFNAQANASYFVDSVNYAACPPLERCSASKDLNEGSSLWILLYFQWFRYRIKLNKCCAWKNIRSEWDEVFYPQEWLDWLRWIETSEEPQPPEPANKPVKTPRVWVWSGTPPRCDESSSDSVVIDPYDYEPMWSPWSMIVKPPAGVSGQGIVMLRDYKQKCYDAPFENMPGIFGEYNESDSTPEPV